MRRRRAHTQRTLWYALSGLIVDLVGYQGVFLIALIFLLVASSALARIREPRELEMQGATHAG